MENVKKSWSNQILIWLFILSFIVAAGACFYRYLYTKNYTVRVEASCNPEVENCFYRDCEASSDECPPNNLSVYKVYNIKAYDFETCSESSCKNECETGTIQCERVGCDESSGDICAAIPE